MKTNLTELEAAREPGLRLKALHDAEEVAFGDRGLTRPRSRGALYDIPPDNGTYCADKVDQTGKDMVDLNLVMKRFEKTGKLEELIGLGMSSNAGNRYDNFIGAPEFQEALNISNHAKDQFSLLDAKVRNRFGNDPAKFLAFVGTPGNQEELYTMGLAIRPAASTASTGAPAPSGTPPSPAVPTGS
nr:MAG TPA: Scaffold protein [Microviridae sp.]